MKKCYRCKNEVPGDIKKCPNCGAYNIKKRYIVISIFLIAAIIDVLGLGEKLQKGNLDYRYTVAYEIAYYDVGNKNTDEYYKIVDKHVKSINSKFKAETDPNKKDLFKQLLKIQYAYKKTIPIKVSLLDLLDFADVLDEKSAKAFTFTEYSALILTYQEGKLRQKIEELKLKSR